jgi:predicted MFS family arabinose efflux permease
MAVTFMAYFLVYEGIEKLYMIDDLGFSEPQILWPTLVIAIVQFAGELPSGTLGDRWGWKKTVLAGEIALLVGTLIMWRASGFWDFMLGSAFIGIFMAFESGSMQAWIVNNIEEELGEEGDQDVNVHQLASSRLLTANLLGIFLSAIASGFVADTWGYRMTYVVTLVFIVASLLVIARIPHAQNPDPSEKSFQKVVRSWQMTNRVRVLRHTLLVSVLLGSVMRIVSEFTQPYLRDIGYGVKWIGVIFGVASLAGALGSFSATRFRDQPWLSPSLFLAAVLAMGLTGLLGVQYIGAVILLLALFFRMQARSWLVGIASQNFPEAIRASGISLIQLANQLAVWTGVLIGWVVSSLASISLVFVVMFALAITFVLRSTVVIRDEEAHTTRASQHL